ncbi:hypothetical protein [Aquimarina algiphila]|uniref:hypothetical protein n=1 Tax=Aquimarina algiphila TaxID=2047982 RepID=UPI002491590E|nr:hypothetical protein [Aquimarina algiphila]
MEGNIKKMLSESVEQVFAEYGLVIACLAIGMFIGWYFKLIFADRKYNKQIKIRFEEKDQRIAELNYIVYERLKKVSVEQKDKTFFKGLKRFFKKFRLKKK